jgi:hypothetical protein
LAHGGELCPTICNLPARHLSGGVLGIWDFKLPFYKTNNDCLKPLCPENYFTNLDAISATCFP